MPWMCVDQNHPEAASLIPFNINDSELIMVNTEKIWQSIFIFNKVLTNIVASVQFLEIAATRWKTPPLNPKGSKWLFFLFVYNQRQQRNWYHFLPAFNIKKKKTTKGGAMVYRDFCKTWRWSTRIWDLMNPLLEI